MAEISDYQNVLENLRGSAVESKDVRSFFTHLYSYTEKVFKTDVLKAAAIGIYAKSYLRDNPESTLGDLFKARKFLEPDIVKAVLTKSESDFRIKSRAYYSLILLYTFYHLFETVSDVESREKHPKLPDEIIEKLRTQLSNIYDNNSDEGNAVLTRANYEMHLNIFHRVLVESPSQFTIEVVSPEISDSTSNANLSEPSQIKIVGEAHLRFEGRVLYVDLPNNRSEVLRVYREGQAPFSLMEYIYKTYATKPDTEFSRTDFSDKVDDFMYDTIPDALRACGFDRHVKSMFFTRASRGKIMFSPTKLINEVDLQQILNCVKKNEKKRKSTGSHKKV